MRNLGQLAKVTFAIAVLAYIGVFFFDRSLPVSAQRVNDSRWEHCFVSYDSTATKGAIDKYEGTANITYFSSGSMRTEQIKGTADDDATSASKNALSQAVARLGSSGWELVAAGPAVSSDGAAVLYFKRQQK